MPTLAAGRRLFWQEQEGKENIKQMVVGSSESWSVTRKSAAKGVEFEDVRKERDGRTVNFPTAKRIGKGQ